MLKLNKTKMENTYCILFWVVAFITVLLTVFCFYNKNISEVRDFSLPLLGLIFTIGQLWQNEGKNRFEKEKYIQSRQDLYFDKKVEIALSINKYLEQMSFEASKPFFNKEMEFNHQQFVLMQVGFYRDTVDKAKFLFDENFIEKIQHITDILEKIQQEIQIMQNHLMLSEKHRDSKNFQIAQENYKKYWNHLWNESDLLCKQAVKQINIEEKVNA